MHEAQKPEVPPNLLNLKPVVRFEPDAVVVDDGNDRDGNFHQPGGNGRYARKS